MVNAGATATASLARGETIEARWRFLHRGLSRFVGRESMTEIRRVAACAEAADFDRAADDRVSAPPIVPCAVQASRARFDWTADPGRIEGSDRFPREKRQHP